MYRIRRISKLTMGQKWKQKRIFVSKINKNVLYQNLQNFIRTLDTVEKVEEMQRLCEGHKKYLLKKEREGVDWNDEGAELFFLRDDKDKFPNNLN